MKSRYISKKIPYKASKFMLYKVFFGRNENYNAALFFYTTDSTRYIYT